MNIPDWKINVVEAYIETSFKECVMYCTDENIISAEKEKEIMTAYNENEETEHIIVSMFFDELGITEEEFLEISTSLDLED